MLRVCGLATLLLAACATPSPEATVADMVTCTGPRPQVCTMEYAPVCAALIGGGAREFSSACNACASESVSGYVSGACAE